MPDTTPATSTRRRWERRAVATAMVLAGVACIALALEPGYVEWMALRWWEVLGQVAGGGALVIGGVLAWVDRL